MAPKISEEAKEMRRVAILEAAEICFDRKGYYETSIDDIVRESHMSKGAIYTYFTSKVEIFTSLMNYITERSFQMFESQFSQQLSATEKLKFIIVRNFVLYTNSKNMQRVHYEFWLYASSFPKLQEMMKERSELFNSIIAEIVKEGITNGEFKKDVDPATVASLYWSFRDGIWLHQLTVGDAEQFERNIRLFENMIFDYLTK